MRCISRAALMVSLWLCMLPSVNAFEAVNKLDPRLRNPEDGARIIAQVESMLERAVFRDEVVKITVQDVYAPHKVMVDIVIRDRLAKAELAQLSGAVRDGAGGGYRRYFVGFYLESDMFSYWATAHHNPKLKVEILGLTDEVFAKLKERVAQYKPPSGQKIIAEAIVRLGFSFHVVILKTKAGYLEMKYDPKTGKPWPEHGEPLEKRAGRYWATDNDLKENYRVRRGMLEIHDKDGFITKSALVSR